MRHNDSAILRTDISSKYIRLALLNTLNWTPRWFHSSGPLSCKDLSSIYSRIFWEGVIKPERREKALHFLRFRCPPAGNDRALCIEGRSGKFINGAANYSLNAATKSTIYSAISPPCSEWNEPRCTTNVESKEDLPTRSAKHPSNNWTMMWSKRRSISDPFINLRLHSDARRQLAPRPDSNATALAERVPSSERLAEIVSNAKGVSARGADRSSNRTTGPGLSVVTSPANTRA